MFRHVGGKLLAKRGWLRFVKENNWQAVEVCFPDCTAGPVDDHGVNNALEEIALECCVHNRPVC